MYSDVGIPMYVSAITFMVAVLQIQNSQQTCPINVALNRVTTQSSTWDGKQYNEGIHPSNLAVDGIHDSCTHTDPAQWGNVTWTVDLGDIYQITAINITNSHIHAERLNGFVVTSWTQSNRNHQTIYEDRLNRLRYAENPISIPINDVITAQYVQITLPQDDYDRGRILTLCEVQIYAICCSTPTLMNGHTVPQGLTYQVAAHTTLVDRCSIGFLPRGSNNLTCGEDGIWSHSLTCTVQSCGSPRTPINGMYNQTTGVYVYQTVVKLICDTGYKTQTPVYRTCQANGAWTSVTGKCEIQSCGSPGNPTNGRYSQTTGVYQTVVMLICDTGYNAQTPGYNAQTPGYRTCQENGTWTSVTEKCEIQSCRSPGNPTNGMYNQTTGVYVYQNVVKLICDKGYKTQTPGYRTCQENGAWTSVTGKCETKSCGSPNHPTNGRFNASFGTYLDVITLICDEGFELERPVLRQCLANQTWSTETGECRAQSCGSPGNTEHGSYSSTTGVYQDSILLLCDTGYQIQKPINRTCQANGTWSPLTEKCHPRVKCEVPQLVEHGHYSLGLDTTAYYQDRTWFTCIPGYVIYINGHQKDNYTRMCLPNSSWGGHEPQCLDASLSLGKDSETYPWPVLLVGVGIGVALTLLSVLVIFASVAYTRRKRKKKSSANELYTIPTATREDTQHYDELERPDSFNGGNPTEDSNQYEITDP